MSVTLRKRKNANGTTSLRLDIYKDGKHVIETLKHLQLAKASNLADRESNKEKIRQAEAIALQRATLLQANNYNLNIDLGRKTEVVIWFQSYVDTYTKKDKRTLQAVVKQFSEFLKVIKKTGLTFGDMDTILIEDFIDFLEERHTGEGAKSYYGRFKKMVKHAYRRKIILTNVLDTVERTAKGKAKKRDILTLEELSVLASTPTQNKEVRKAFLFTCCTGLRWCDVKSLKWENIRIEGKRLNIRQSKTEEELSIHLNETALTILGRQENPTSFVFKLPSANGCNKTLKSWVKRAGIPKTITWHNGRHSFGTNLIYNEVDALTASKLLGHTSLRHTQRYIDAAEEMKETATNKIKIAL